MIPQEQRFHPFPLLFAPLLQTAQDARRRSSRASPSWHWRSSGTSAASSAKRAGSSSLESTSASECCWLSLAGLSLAAGAAVSTQLWAARCGYLAMGTWLWGAKQQSSEQVTQICDGILAVQGVLGLVYLPHPSPPSPEGMESHTASLTTMRSSASSVRHATGTSAAGSWR